MNYDTKPAQLDFQMKIQETWQIDIYQRPSLKTVLKKLYDHSKKKSSMGLLFLG